ncbi:MAG: hypothetical protein HUU02_04010 [Bacteroidetes bacterium]|nr:hypothetical protein [Bacteroidota bacterium]
MERHEKLAREFSDMGILFNSFAKELDAMVTDAKAREDELDEFDMLALTLIHEQTASIAKQINMLKYALDGKVWFKELNVPKQP